MMGGSGLEEILGIIYGTNTIEHVLSGKAYARAIRGHLLICGSLTQLLLRYLLNDVDPDSKPFVLISDDSAQQLCGSLDSVVIDELKVLYDTLVQNKIHIDDCSLFESPCYVKLCHLLCDLKNTLSEQSRTARLWLLYMYYIECVLRFITAERTGNWLLHLDTLESMLPLFAATGHTNYARSARVYLHQMRQLSETHPWLESQFASGLNSVQRSDRFWAGLSTDLVIEQTLYEVWKECRGTDTWTWHE